MASLSSVLPTFTLKPSAYPLHPKAPDPPTVTCAIVGSIAGTFCIALLIILIKASTAPRHAKPVSVPDPNAPEAPPEPPNWPSRPSSSTLVSLPSPPGEHELSILPHQTSTNASLPIRSMPVSSLPSRLPPTSHSFKTSEISSLESRVFSPESSENTANLGFGQMPFWGESERGTGREEYRDTVLSWDPYAEEEGRR